MSRKIHLLLLSFAVALIAASPSRAQVNTHNQQTLSPPPKTPATPSGEIYGGYMIGVGDILDVHISDEDEASGRYQVDQQGAVRLPLLKNSIPAAGSSTFEFSTRLSDELKKEDILKQPSVSVLIVRGMTQNVSVMGAVLKPGTYPIEKPTTLVELISMAGGLAPNAGTTLTLAHTGTNATQVMNASVKTGTTAPAESTFSIPALMAGTDPGQNVTVQAGDVVTVNTGPIVFVVGAVGRPGAFAVQDQRPRMTILQALAMAGGTTPVASLSRTIIIRKSPNGDGEQQEIRLDLKRILTGKDKDETLMANDILFVPQSSIKAGLKRLGDIGAQAAGSAAGYAVIY